ncbi:rli1 (nucleomorph) [Hemiselmis andersenii]|uniref:Rli1 n=1 Tax=Hemiselmis andersenii TaxID=464988 RepID=A9BKY3_HEMAN|nr:rli1 [Hemiselmis andersenii]ABW98138.1 rli1 [Hemiselmis andersenii]|mmetsp:Transcript_24204/g.56160  ORF Transcript_24204/g.56160 Transcript_24204/m.56160 type:complete len:600 (-) Transcript_24204:557-2356(-)
MEKNLIRIGIVSPEKCKPSKCKFECKKNCPIVRTGKFCIQIDFSENKAKISEELCIGCGICIKKCPFGAITICNFPKEINNKKIHQFGINSFRLFRLPNLKSGQILGIIGINGIGKTTALKILAGKLKPNLGNFSDPPQWIEIIKNFRGNDLQGFFNLLSKNKLKISIKPQYIDSISDKIKGTVEKNLIVKNSNTKIRKEIIQNLSLDLIYEKEIQTLSGGELQRFAIGFVLLQNADVFLFDELTSYLDVKQRIAAAKVIRKVLAENGKAYMIVVEHDLAIIDYLSSFICCIYGKQGAYGVVTVPYTVKEGINIFLSGFIPSENLRFRENSLNFTFCKKILNQNSNSRIFFSYPKIEKTLGSFQLKVENGEMHKSEIIVLLGENGSGKTTFVKLIGNILKTDENCQKIEKMRISYKPQQISPNFNGSVKKLISEKLSSNGLKENFKEKIFSPLNLESLLEKKVENLSGGELQRISIAMCLAKSCEIYLIDEPSAYLDLEQRMNVAKIIKNFIYEEEKSSFIVEHDFMMSTYLADKVIVFEKKNEFSKAGTPQKVGDGMNLFLKDLEITFRRDTTNFRPRINKLDSLKDREQKLEGKYFY